MSLQCDRVEDEVVRKAELPAPIGSVGNRRDFGAAKAQVSQITITADIKLMSNPEDLLAMCLCALPVEEKLASLVPNCIETTRYHGTWQESG